MKVLVVSHSAVVDVYREKFQRLARLGATVHLALPAGWPEGGRWQAAPVSGPEGDIQVHTLPVVGAGHVGAFALRGLARLAEEIRPDLVHAEEEPYAFACWQAWRASRRLKVPFLFLTWENLLRRYRPPLNWFDRGVLSGAAGAVAGNHEAETVLRARGYRGPCAVIPQYGVDPAVFVPRPEAGRRGDAPLRIGYFGRLLEEKGLSTLLRAVCRLRYPVQVTFTGNGAFRAYLQRQVAAWGLQRVVRFAPAVPHAAMPQALLGADVLVLPSETRPTWKEQFGRVLVEAMACGVPVIGSDSGEIPVTLGEAGLIFHEGDDQGLAAQLTALQSDPGLAYDLGQRGRARVLANFTTVRIVGQTWNILQRIQGRAR